MILEPVVRSGAGGSYAPRVGVELIGVKDGNNTVFTTPDKFKQDAETKVALYWNARRMKVGRDFAVSESGGVGTGFDTITFSPWSAAGFLPRATDELVADYYIDPNV